MVADWSRKEGSRILKVWQWHDDPHTRRRIRPGDQHELTMAMPALIADGFDGYACFQDQEALISEEAGFTDTQLLLRTLGYRHGHGEEEGCVKEMEEEDEGDEAVELDELRFKRARDAICQ